jgi:hypothetical protein
VNPVFGKVTATTAKPWLAKCREWPCMDSSLAPKPCSTTTSGRRSGVSSGVAAYTRAVMASWVVTGFGRTTSVSTIVA